MSVICIKVSFGIALVTINKCTVRVCATRTLSQNRVWKHSEVSRTPKESLINKSTDNSKSLDSNLLSNSSLLFSYPICDTFYLLLRIKLCLYKMNIICFCLGNSNHLNFISLHFRTHLDAGELQSRKHTIFRKGRKFEIKMKLIYPLV